MDMTMSFARPERLEVVTSVQRRRRWTPEQKLAIVKQTNEPGSSVSLVAREHGLTAAQLFQWRKAYFEGSLVAVGANETVVPASELQEAMKRIKQLEGALDTRKHEGQVAVKQSNTRWCSDGLELSCDNGERDRVAFALNSVVTERS